MLPPEDRGLANGIFASGSAMGAFLAPFIITPLAKAYGWRVAFFVIGALGVFWILLWLLATRGPHALVAYRQRTRRSGGACQDHPCLRKRR